MSLQEVLTMSADKPRMPLGEFSSSRINTIGTAHVRPTKINSGASLPSIKSLINCSSPVREPTVDVTASNNKLTQQEFNQITKKLKIRLQFAYFKLKTNQTSMKFKDLQKQREKPKTKHSHRNVKRRRLLVGHSNLKTPAKSIVRQQAPEYENTSIQGKGPSEKSPQNRLKFYQDTTPVGKSSVNLLQNQKQDTPMSVKAAKSLLHLFTSSQQS